MGPSPDPAKLFLRSCVNCNYKILGWREGMNVCEGDACRKPEVAVHGLSIPQKASWMLPEATSGLLEQIGSAFQLRLRGF